MSGPDIHDRLFKATFSDKELAEAEFRALLPKAVVDRLDFEKMVIEESLLVDEDLGSRQCDILYRIPLIEGGEAFIWLLFEHQSTNKRFMALKFLGYMVRIWERWLKDQDNARDLPIIIPLVLQHDPKGWKAPTRFADLYQGPINLAEGLKPFILDFEYIVDDLTRAPEQDLIDRPGPPAMPLVLLSLKARSDIEPRHYKLLTRAFAAIARAGKHEIAHAILRYSALAAKDGAPIAARAAAQADQDYRRVAMSYAEQLRAEGEARGKAQGKAEGQSEGRKAVMLRQVELKFEAPSPETVARIQNGSDEDLDNWTMRILTAVTLEEFFGE